MGALTIIFWVVWAVLIGRRADKLGRNVFVWFALSFLCSPLISWIILEAMGEKKKEETPEKENIIIPQWKENDSKSENNINTEYKKEEKETEKEQSPNDKNLTTELSTPGSHQKYMPISEQKLPNISLEDILKDSEVIPDASPQTPPIETTDSSPIIEKKKIFFSGNLQTPQKIIYSISSIAISFILCYAYAQSIDHRLRIKETWHIWVIFILFHTWLQNIFWTNKALAFNLVKPNKRKGLKSLWLTNKKVIISVLCCVLILMIIFVAYQPTVDYIEKMKNDRLCMDYFRRGLAEDTVGDYQPALYNLNKTIEINSNYADAYLYRGDSKLHLGDFDGAIEDFNKAIELKPNYADAYLFRGQFKIGGSGISTPQYRDDNGSLSDLNKAIELNPQSAKAYNGRGVLKRENLEDYSGAMTDFNKAIELNPNLAEAYSNRGILNGKLKFNQRMMDDFNHAIIIDPKCEDAYSNRGLIKAALEDYSGAMDDFNKGIEVDSKSIGTKGVLGGIYFNRGSLFAILNKNNDAIADFNKAIELNPNLFEAYCSRGTLLFKQKNFKAAIEDYSVAIKINSKYSGAYFSRGIARMLSGQMESGCSDLRSAEILGYEGASIYITKNCR